MKKSLSATALCLSLLLTASIVFVRHTRAKQDPIKLLLDLPAPPPPNPLWPVTAAGRDEEFYNPSKPPPDNAPIEDLVDYWSRQAAEYERLGYNPKPTPRVVDRLLEEASRDRKLIFTLLNIMPGDDRDSDAVKTIYERGLADGNLNREERAQLKRWLIYNSPAFAADLATTAAKAGPDREYVTNQEEVLALTKTDFDRARPIIDRLYNDPSQKSVSKVLAMWALYRRALLTDSIGDADRYRDELKAVVEDRTATDGMRDLALDALVKEKEWPGRDDWYFSLLEDETLADLRVNGSSYTGLTTMMYYAPPEKYVKKMIELTGSSNIVVRTAAVKNLMVVFQKARDPEVVRALLPWLENPRWVNASSDGRIAIVTALQSIVVPESVPGLLRLLDEKTPRRNFLSNVSANIARLPNKSTIANSNRAVVVDAPDPVDPPSHIVTTNTAIGNTAMESTEGDHHQFRYQAITALATQKDPRAVPVLRRVFSQVEEHERWAVVNALLACNGFSAQDQLDALEAAVKAIPELNDEIPTTAANVRVAHPPGAPIPVYRPATDMKSLLGSQMLTILDVSEELVKLTIVRIAFLDKKDPPTAAALRRVMVKWPAEAVDLLMMQDLKSGRAEADAILRLLARRELLREKLLSDIQDLKSGGAPAAAGIAACLLEDEAEYDIALASPKPETRTALFACGRLIRARIAVAKAAANLQTDNPMLKLAAEKFLESEDSPEARQIVLALHPGEALVLGARDTFAGADGSDTGERSAWLDNLLAGPVAPPEIEYSEHDDYIEGPNLPDPSVIEKRLREEVKTDGALRGVYAYDRNFVRIYSSDRIIFSWSEDDSRYRERALRPDEFDRLKQHFAQGGVDDLKPFLGCSRGPCLEEKELVMLGRNGGRRVYVRTDRQPEFFAKLEEILADFRAEPAVLKYELSKRLPGLEVLLADEDLHADTIWKNGDDLRIFASRVSIRKKFESELEDAIAEADEREVGADDEALVKLRNRGEWEGYSWYKLPAGGAPEFAAQPPGLNRPPLRDSLSVKPKASQWKARGADFEIRTDDEGLYKVTGGRLTKLRSGNYRNAVLSPSGRWVIANKLHGDYNWKLVRVNLLTGRESTIPFSDLPQAKPVAAVHAVNRVLIIGGYHIGDESEESAYNEAEQYPEEVSETGPFFWLDPETAIITPAAGELRPLAEQTFRPLQQSSRPNEFWAAIPANKAEDTQVGLLDTRTAKFRPVITIPKIAFRSMDMWVDEQGGRVYFVYQGHALSLPLPKTPPALR